MSDAEEKEKQVKFEGVEDGGGDDDSDAEGEDEAEGETEASAGAESASASEGGTKKKKGKGGKAKKKKKKGKKGKKKGKGKSGLIQNAAGEWVTQKEYSLSLSLESATRSLSQYKEHMGALIKTNETLQESFLAQERDSIEVIAALHKESENRDDDIKRLTAQLEAERQWHAAEKSEIIESYEDKISELNNVVTEKDANIKVVQQEFAVVNDFRKKRGELMKELENNKIETEQMEKRYRETIAKMEHRFFEEKLRLQKEANRKISELAIKAHKEAVANLKDTTKEIFRENIRMTEALKYHVKEGEDLTKMNDKLVTSNTHLLESKELQDHVVREKIFLSRQKDSEVQQLQQKIATMELALTHVVREFEREREILGNIAAKELGDIKDMSAKMKHRLQKKTAEMKHIKKLANFILAQRSDLEVFFFDALDQVRAAIKTERETKLKEESKKIKLAPIGGAQTNEQADDGSVFAKPLPTNKRVDIHELSWADKEKVIRLLFAKMNQLEAARRQSEATAPRRPGVDIIEGKRQSITRSSISRRLSKDTE